MKRSLSQENTLSKELLQWNGPLGRPIQIALIMLALVFLILFSSTTIPAEADIHYVNLNNASPSTPYTDWPTAAKTIQEAVDVATDGDTVLVADGTYSTGSTVTPGYSMLNRVVITKAITVQSVNGAKSTIIQGSGYGGGTRIRCVYLDSGANLVGFTLTKSYTESSGVDYHDLCGGGIFIEHGGTISNCIITKNGAISGGGGVYCDQGGVLNNCTIEDNSGGYGYGGGIYCNKGGTVTNCKIKNNYAQKGLGVYLNQGGEAYNCLIIKHYDSKACGASYCYQGGKLINCTICDNTGYDNNGSINGVGVYCDNAGIVQNCIIYFNPTNWYKTGEGMEYSHCCTTPDPGGIGNITHDPEIVFHRESYESNYHLLQASPCIDSGCNLYAQGENDLVGKKRILDGTIDIGAYEHATYYVSHDGSNTFPYDTWAKATNIIQIAVDAAFDGDTVIVEDGTYNTGGAAESGHSLMNRVMINKVLLVQSVTGPENTIIQGQGPIGEDAVRCIFLTNRAQLRGFTLENGCTKNIEVVLSHFDKRGGGALISGKGSISNCVVRNNCSYEWGGGVFAEGEGTISDCRIKDNETLGCGGGVYINGYIYTGYQYIWGGATLENSEITSNYANDYGAGVFSYGGIVTNCRIISNTSFRGGGITCYNGAKVIQCVINDNSAFAEDGGGVYIYSGSYFNGSEINNCIINGNDSRLGAAVCSMDPNAIINNCTISGNSNVGVNLQGTMKNCIITENLSVGVGVGVDGTLSNCIITKNLNGGVNCAPGGEVTNCIISRNILNNGEGYSAAGVKLYKSGILNNCLITENRTTESNFSCAGGVYFYEGGTINNCTISDNIAEGLQSRCGGVYCNGGGTLNNCIIYHNITEIQNPYYTDNWHNFGTNISYNYCCTTPALPVGMGPGNIATDPEFIDKNGGNYRLWGGSPCINNGNKAYAKGNYDLDFLPRIYSGTVDMGCYENIIETAFEYKKHYYQREQDPNDSAIEYITSQLGNISDYWGQGARNKALAAAQVYEDSLRIAPTYTALRWSLLDIYYDIAVAELALAREKMVEAFRASLGIGVVAPPGEFLISTEISLLEEALPLYRSAVQPYFALLNDPMGITMAEVDPNVPQGIPFGYYIFQKEVPIRPLMSPLYKGPGGNWLLPEEATPNDIQIRLFNGYKDLVLLFNVQRDYARAAAELARRYILRGAPAQMSEPSDYDKALALIGDVQQSSYIEGSVLLGIFPDYDDPNSGAGSNSGLRESISSWRHEIKELSYLRSYANANTNLLGFTDDFLVLVQSTIPGDPLTQYFDSYNFFAAYLNNESKGGPLYNALVDWNKAMVNYANYRDRQDQLALQFHDRNESYNERLRQIMGAPPGDPAYNVPFENPGSELALQALNIEIAGKKIEANQQEIANLNQQVDIEGWRRGEEKGIHDAIGQVYLHYGEEQQKLTARIADINAAQARANNMAQAAASISVSASFGFPKLDFLSFGVSKSGGAIAYPINAQFQQQQEWNKGGLQQEKERFAALEKADIQALQNDLLDVNSKAQIKTWLLRMNTLVIESQETALVLAQEIGRLFALVHEKEDLEKRKEEANELLADRYFADPSHRSLKDSSILQAELSFERAQQWMFFAVRALEYKWNQTFEHSYQGRTYTAKTLLALRNANELKDMFDAMAEWDTLIGISGRNDDVYKKFSFCQDFLGYRYGSQYFDPVSGELVEPWEAFQSYLSQDSLLLSPVDPENPIPGFKVLRLKFSTVKEASNFFMRSRWLEKIQFMRVKVFGGAFYGIDSTTPGYMEYGGTSYIRNWVKGHPDPEHPDRLLDEMTAYSTRYWYYDPGLKKWQSKQTVGAPISIKVSNDPDVPESVYQINVFKEYSIATSEWTLYLAVEDPFGYPLIGLDSVTDIEIHFYFYFYAPRI